MKRGEAPPLRVGTRNRSLECIAGSRDPKQQLQQHHKQQRNNVSSRHSIKNACEVANFGRRDIRKPDESKPAQPRRRPLTLWASEEAIASNGGFFGGMLLGGPFKVYAGL